MTFLRRTLLASGLVAAVLATPAAFAATPGFTPTERSRALELFRRLVARKVSEDDARPMAQVYLRRAYVLDVDPAESVARRLFHKEHRLDADRRHRYFAWALDALLRGANPKEVNTIFKRVIPTRFGRDDERYFIESFLGVASQHASPVPLVEMLEIASDNGLAGKRRRNFIAWAVARVRRGENPAYMRRLYGVAADRIPSLGDQQRFLDKCYHAIERGASAPVLAEAVERLGKKHELAKRLEADLDKILALYFAGRPLEDAMHEVVPPPKPPAEGLEEETD